jgi:hypothetical protein
VVRSLASRSWMSMPSSASSGARSVSNSSARLAFHWTRAARGGGSGWLRLRSAQNPSLSAGKDAHPRSPITAWKHLAGVR